jgi:vacuolar-type H+-ATPase subunit I/STV1
MKLITYYVALALVGNVIAAILCLVIEKVAPSLSMPIFLALFFLILWQAWVLAVKWTDPERERASIFGAASKQKA